MKEEKLASKLIEAMHFSLITSMHTTELLITSCYGRHLDGGATWTNYK